MKPTDGIVSRYINRRISIPISRFLVSKFGDVSPNKITITTTLFGFLAASIYVLRMPLIAGILVQLASILDGVDGEVARMLKKQSRFGGFLDSLLDRLVDISVIICFSIYAWWVVGGEVGPILFMLLGYMAISGSIMVSFFNARAEASLGIHPRNIGGLPIATRDVRLFIVFLGSIISVFIHTALIGTLLAIGILTYSYLAINALIICRNYTDGPQSWERAAQRKNNGYVL